MSSSIAGHHVIDGAGRSRAGRAAIDGHAVSLGQSVGQSAAVTPPPVIIIIAGATTQS